MSAYIVDRETIQYLVQSGLEAAFQSHQGRTMHWYHDGESHWLDDRNASDVGQMLWEENIKSVAYRYSDTAYQGLPGPTRPRQREHLHLFPRGRHGRLHMETGPDTQGDGLLRVPELRASRLVEQQCQGVH